MESNHVHRPGCGCAGFELSDKDDNLFDVIELDGVQCLNEDKRDTCKKILRPEEERKDIGELLQSPSGDPEIILVIP